MLNRNITFAALLGVLFLFAAPGAQAAYIEHTYSKAFSASDWTDTWFLPKYDDLGGTQPLTSIYFELFGEVRSDVRFENTGPSPRDVTWSIAATLELQRPDLSVIVVTIPTVGGTDSLTAFDGLPVDYTGTSGRTYLGLRDDATETHTSPPPAGDLALFTGAGTIDLPISAVANSGGFSGGNWALLIDTDARAEGKVRYYYADEIPEPGTVALMALGLVGLAGFACKRRKREEEA